MKQLKFLMGILLLISLFFISCRQQDSAIKTPPKAVQGILDLKSWNFESNGTISLKGEWSFYPKEFVHPKDFISDNHQTAPAGSKNFIHVPKIWNDHPIGSKTLTEKSYATYRLKIILRNDDSHSQDLQKKTLAFKIPAINTAYDMYVNKKKLISVGKIGKDSQTSSPLFFPKVVDFYHDQTELLEVVFHVSNFSHKIGGISKPILLGMEDDIRAVRDASLIFEIFLFGNLLIMGLYHLGLYWFRRKDRAPMYFGVLCLVFALRTQITGDVHLTNIFPHINWRLLISLEYLSFYLLSPLVAGFFHSLFREYFSRKLLIFVFTVGMVYTLIMFVTPPIFFTKLVRGYHLVTVAVAFYTIYILVQASRKKEEGALAFLLGFIFLFLTGINDILHANYVIRTGHFSSFGFFIFIFSQAFILSLRFSKGFMLSEELTDSYSRFVPFEFFNFLQKRSILDVGLGDNIQKDMSILFCDIRSFSTISEKMTPQENFNFINSILGQTSPIIRKYHGFIDKYIGDAIMALFGRGPRDAIDASIAITEAVRTYNQQKKQNTHGLVRVGIGINTGSLMLGTIGERDRMEGTVISDAVNLASRLEGLTKEYQVDIIASEDTLDAIGDPEAYHSRVLDWVRVKGKDKAIHIFEIYDADLESVIKLKDKSKEFIREGLENRKKREWGEAISCFKKALEIFPQDRGAQIHINRCRKLEGMRLPKNWDGTAILS